MKLTDEMCDAIAECARRWNWERMGETSARARIREDLQQAFNALPDPEEVRAEIMDELAYGRSVEMQRAWDAEAKLEKVRAWRVKYDEPAEYRNGLSHEAGEALDAILDGKEGT